MSTVRTWNCRTVGHRRVPVVMALLMILAGGLVARAQQGDEKEVIVAGDTYVSSRPFPVMSYAYDVLRANCLKDWNDVYNATPDYYVRPAVANSFRALAINGVLRVGGALRGMMRGSVQQYINLNEDSGDEAALVHSLQVAHIIIMEGAPPSPSGKYVYDVAESMNALGAGPADVVIISPQQDVTVEPSTKPYDTRVAGVISTEPKLYLGPDKTKQPLALAGVVLCKASGENGPIKPGDLLVTSSQPGHAMRADPKSVKTGMLVGRALEPLAQGTGSINILINQ